MPSVLARMAAGISVASWNSAVLRAWFGRRPSRFSRRLSRSVLMGRPGWPPGNSQRDAAVAPMVAWPLRLVTTVRVSSSTGSGSRIGVRPKLIRTLASVIEIWSVVSRLIVDVALRVDEQEQASETILDLDHVVVQQVSGRLPIGDHC